MKTLAQIRAANALQSAPTVQLELDRSGQGDALSGFPMLILIDGLLAALAFSVERKRNDHGQIVPKHAAHLAIAVAPCHAPQARTHRHLLGHGCQRPSEQAGQGSDCLSTAPRHR